MPGTYPGKRGRSRLKPVLGQLLDRSHPLASGLIGCWPFNEGNGTTITDLTGNVRGLSAWAGAWGSGFDGPTLTFNGAGNHVDFLAYPLLTAATRLSIATRVRPDVLDSTFREIVRSASGGTGWFLVQNTSNSFSWAGDSASYTNTFAPALVGRRDSLVATIGDGTGKLYQNGFLVQNNAQSLSTTGPGVAIGNAYGLASQFFSGQIDYLYLWNRVLSPAEAASLAADPYGLILAPTVRRFYRPAAVGGTVASPAALLIGGF